MTAELIDFSQAASAGPEALLDLALRSLSPSEQIALGQVSLRLDEGREQAETRVRVVALLSDEEARGLYGPCHVVGLPLGSARHADRIDAAVMALRAVMARRNGTLDLAA